MGKNTTKIALETKEQTTKIPNQPPLIKEKLNITDPDKTTCTKNGGEWSTPDEWNISEQIWIKGSKKACKANWKDAREICNALERRLPNIDEIRSLAVECGVKVYDYEHNGKNSSYQSCYKLLGFSSDSYWSSSTYRPSEEDAWSVVFNDNYIRALHKSISSYVRCVHDEE